MISSGRDVCGSAHKSTVAVASYRLIFCLLLAASLTRITSAFDLQSQPKRVFFCSFESEAGPYSDLDDPLRLLKSGGVGRVQFYTQFLEPAHFPNTDHERDMQGGRSCAQAPLTTAGVMAAGVGLQIPMGKKPAELPVVSEDTARYAFDWRELQRGRIREQRLLPGALLRFERASVWEIYKWRVAFLGVLISAETMLIVLLLIQRRKRIEAESSLRSSGERYRSLVESSHDWVWEVNADGTYTYVGPQCRDLLGYEPSELIGKQPFDLMPPEEAQRVRLAFGDIVARRAPFRALINTSFHKDGRLIVLETSGVPIFDGKSGFRGYRGMDRDITKRKPWEDALRQQAAFDEVMTRTLNRFVVCASSEVDDAVMTALGTVAEFIGADHAFVVRFAADLTGWTATHEWCGGGVSPRKQELQKMPMGTLPWNEQRLLSGQVVRINAPDDYPSDAVEERRFVKTEGHLSALIMPVRTEDGVWNCVELHCHSRPVTWSEDDVSRLRMVTDLVATALHRKETLEVLRKSEEKFSRAFDASPVAMTLHSLTTGRFIEANRAYEENTGFRPDEVIGRTPEELGISFSSGTAAAVHQFLTNPECLRKLETQYRNKAGDLRSCLLSRELVEFGGEPCNLLVLEDITERKLTEQRLHELGARLLMVQEEERRRIARELHDDFSQRLALLAIDLEQLAQRTPAAAHEWSARLDMLWSQTQELTADLHRLSYQLHPSKLEDLGLVEAVRSYCHGLFRQAGLKVNFSHSDVPRMLPNDVSLCVYRVVQEALHNVVKHSGVNSAAVQLSGGTGEVRLLVSDAGKGFALESVSEREGLGLVSIQERVRHVRGELCIDARPSGGTRIAVRIPVPSRQVQRYAATG